MGGGTMKQRYDSYKPSGIDWIGEIPSHWKLSTLGKHFQVILGKMLCPKPLDASYTLEEYYCAGDVHFDGVNNSNLKRMWFTPEEKNKYLVKDGDLLIVEGGAGAGGCALPYVDPSKNRYVQNSILIVRHKRNSTTYLKYLIEYLVKSGYVDIECNEATFAHFTKEKVCKIPFPVMPIAEQEAIAAWLDEKCGEIDVAIAKVDREIELIDELKQSEISRVVTRGLNPDASLRPSGIDWIGDVPEHWKVSKLKYLISEISSGGTPTSSNSEFYCDEGIPWVAIGDMSTSDYINVTAKHITEAGKEDKNLKKYSAGTLLYSIYATIGKVAELTIPACINQAILALVPSDSIIKLYLKYVLKGMERYVISLTSSNTQANLSADKVNNYILPVPPLSEQKEIADYLDKKCAEIDGLKAKLVKKREALKELRQAIISEVVTGKRKVI